MGKRKLNKELQSHDVYLLDEMGVPILLLRCMQFMLCFSLETEGIFRVSPSYSSLNEFLKIFKAGGDVIFDQVTMNDYLAASLLKSYFRDLDKPFIPLIHHRELIIVTEMGDRQEMIDVLRDLMPNYLTHTEMIILKYITSFLYTVAEHSENNKMSIQNLATVWSPSLFHSSNEAQKLVELWIEEHISIFGDDEGIQSLQSRNITTKKKLKRHTSTGIRESQMAKSKKARKSFTFNLFKDKSNDKSNESNESYEKSIKSSRVEITKKIDTDRGGLNRSRSEGKRKRRKKTTRKSSSDWSSQVISSLDSDAVWEKQTVIFHPERPEIATLNLSPNEGNLLKKPRRRDRGHKKLKSADFKSNKDNEFTREKPKSSRRRKKENHT